MKRSAVPSFTVFREPRHDCAVRTAGAPDNRSRQRLEHRRQSDNTDRHRWAERLQFRLDLLALRLQHCPQFRVGHRVGYASVAVGNFLLNFVHPQVALSHVDGCRGRGIAREAQLTRLASNIVIGRA